MCASVAGAATAAAAEVRLLVSKPTPASPHPYAPLTPPTNTPTPHPKTRAPTHQSEMSILDEIDSGLDIDALRDVSAAVNGLKRDDKSILMVTHYKVRVCARMCALVLRGECGVRVEGDNGVGAVVCFERARTS